MNNIKYKHPLEIIIFGVIPIINYKGCLLEKLKEGYKVLGQKVSTPKEVDEVISKAGKSLEKSGNYISVRP